MSTRNIAGVTAILLLAAFLATGAQEPEPAEDTAEKRLYLVLFATGPGYVEEAGTSQPGISEHLEFIMGMHADGVVPLGGPLFDDDERKQVSGIVYFVKAGSSQEAREIASREPMVKTQVVEIVSVQEFLTGVGVGCLD